MAVAAWSAAALHLKARDRFIGWTEEQRRPRLALVVNNSRLWSASHRSRWRNVEKSIPAAEPTLWQVPKAIPPPQRRSGALAGVDFLQGACLLAFTKMKRCQGHFIWNSN